MNTTNTAVDNNDAVMVAAADWMPRAAGLAAQLRVASPAWAPAFAAVPRHLFAPTILEGDATLSAGQPGWLEAVYANEALLTHTIPTEGGQRLPSSSSSQPTVMAVMLERLEARAVQRVLEIGTGTGYNTALLAHRLGDRHVTSIDIHPVLVGQARDRLAALGHHPALRVGDGTAGLPEHAPYDRILATCALTSIPPAWIGQLTDGGRVVAPLDAGTTGPLLVLDKTGPDELRGRIDAHHALFMPLRHAADNPGQTDRFTATTSGAHYGTTGLDPSQLLADDPDLALFCWLHLPGLRVAGGPKAGIVVVHTADSMAQAQLHPLNGTDWPVTQRGPRRLWDTIEHALTTYEQLGRPGRDRYTVTASTDPPHQYVWLDDEPSTHSFPLPS